MRGVALAVAVGCVWPAVAAAQNPPADPPQTYLLEYSTAPMLRNAALAEASVRLIEVGADWVADRTAGDLFTRKSKGGFFARLGRWVLFDLAIDSYGAAIAHEYGHSARAEELGRRAQVHLGPFNSAFFTSIGAPLTPVERMTLFGAGLEGGEVLNDRIGDRMYADGLASQADLTTLVWTAFGSTAYTLNALSERRLETPLQLLTGGRRPGLPGDPVHYVLGLTGAQLGQPAFTLDDVTRFFPEIEANARTIRRRSMLNLLDYSLLGASVGLVRDYLWRGERDIEPWWIPFGPVSLVPGAGYALTPVGPETRIRTRYKIGATIGSAYVRWTDEVRAEDRGLVGAGGELQTRTVRGIRPKFGFDAWRNPDGTTGLRGELAATYTPPASRWTLSAAVSAKSRGYVTAYPLEAGRYITFGGGFRF